ncbi:TolC family protein [Pseudomonas cremoricolorata]|uniref:TolC family protein n=1 Tax=Pseudomonas cremoricolorata TaxID=157783 RepID=UPI00067E897E|nr:TolC family protein [Pseudomonas cremoricolorata]
MPPGLSEQPLPARWWSVFDDPQLDRWVERALAHNQRLAEADAHIQVLLAGLDAEQARRLPSTELSLAADYGKRADEQILATAEDRHASTRWRLSPGLDLSYQIDVWGQVRAAIERAATQVQAAQAARELLRLQVALQTSRAYLDQCAAQARLEQTRQGLDNLQRSVRLLERLQRAGVAGALEVERLLALRDTLRARLPPLQAAGQVAAFELSQLSGHAQLDESASCRAIPQPSGALPLGDGWPLLARRPDLRQAERELRAASLGVQVATADLYPQVRFGAALAASDSHLDGLGNSRALTFGIGPLITWQFPNLRANRARVDQAQALRQGQIARYHGVALAALKQVRQALAEYSAAQEALDGAGAALAHGEQAQRLLRHGLAAGSVDGLTVLDSERQLLGLRARQVDARVRLAHAQLMLLHALGGRWQHHPPETENPA